MLAVPCGVGTPEYIGCGYYCCAARRTQLTAHWSLRRAHTARAAVPGLRPGQRRPSAGSPALRRAPSAGQCRPSAGHSVPQCRPSAGTPCPSAGQCRPSASTPCPQRRPVPAFGRALRAPVPAFGRRMGSIPQCTVALSASWPGHACKLYNPSKNASQPPSLKLSPP